MCTDRSQSAIRSIAASPMTWNTASTRLSVSTSSAAKESKGPPSTATGSTMSASSAAGESDSSVIRMTLVPQVFALDDDLLGGQFMPTEVKDDRDRVAPGAQVLPDVCAERLVGVVHIGNQLIQLHRQHAGDQPREVTSGDDDVLRASGKQRNGPFDFSRRHSVVQSRHRPERAARPRAEEDAVVGRCRPPLPGTAQRAPAHGAGHLGAQALLEIGIAAEAEPAQQAQHGWLARPCRGCQRGRALEPCSRVAGEQGARHLPLGRRELVHPLKDLVSQRQLFGGKVRHVVSTGSGPVPRAENIAGELCATTMRPSPPTATRPPVDPRWASSCSKVSRIASARPAPA